jgi:hypothetical protein
LCHSYRENSPAWCCVFVCTRHELVLMLVFQVLARRGGNAASWKGG